MWRSHLESHTGVEAFILKAKDTRDLISAFVILTAIPNTKSYGSALVVRLQPLPFCCVRHRTAHGATAGASREALWQASRRYIRYGRLIQKEAAPAALHWLEVDVLESEVVALRADVLVRLDVLSTQKLRLLDHA